MSIHTFAGYQRIVLLPTTLLLVSMTVLKLLTLYSLMRIIKVSGRDTACKPSTFRFALM